MRFNNGTQVETIEPKTSFEGIDDRTPDGLAARKWSVSGEIIDASRTHGLVYKVKHADGTEAWYLRHELKERNPNTDYSPEERVVMLQKMQALSDLYYGRACAAGCHAFIEFAGLMNEFIKVCADAHKVGQDFPFSNTHSGDPLPFQPFHMAYLAEKLNCIYGPGLLSNEANARTFVEVLFDGQYKLVPADQEPLPEGTKIRFAEEDEL